MEPEGLFSQLVEANIWRSMATLRKGDLQHVASNDSTNEPLTISLSALNPGMQGFVSEVRVDGLLYRRLLDLGVVEGAAIEAVFASPSGDPVVFRIRGADIALRRSDAALVDVRLGAAPPSERGCVEAASEVHRCRGCRTTGEHLPPDEPRRAAEGALIVALAGNPNTGKSTVFNALTGLRQHVGNWPGKTVMRAEGQWTCAGRRLKLVDLPGTYSLLSTSVEEEIARDFILFGNPDCTVVVADATCLERNLNLVVQILQITPRAVVCVNLMDEARRKGVSVDTTALSQHLGVPVVATAARRKQGLSELQEAILGVATGAVATNPVVLRYDNALEEAVEALIPHVEKALPGVPNPRWIALRLIDGGDARLLEEIEAKLLCSTAGRIGADSLPSRMPASGTGPRR